jgi:hypothetical protein
MQEHLQKYGAIYVKKLIPTEFCNFFTHVLLRQADLSGKEGHKNGDEQIPNAKAIMDHDILFETLQEYLWPTIEQIVGEPLLPTYAYTRLYNNGDELKKHSDRPACEISVTIQLGRSHHYSWPIYMGGQRYDIAEGDGVIYTGCNVDHWREICNGPKDYYSGQTFLHYVRQNGPYAHEAGDSTFREPAIYIKNRPILMNNK